MFVNAQTALKHFVNPCQQPYNPCAISCKNLAPIVSLLDAISF